MKVELAEERRLNRRLTQRLLDIGMRARTQNATRSEPLLWLERTWQAKAVSLPAGEIKIVQSKYNQELSKVWYRDPML